MLSKVMLTKIREVTCSLKKSEQELMLTSSLW